tara:strand:- start:3365 stop:3727 length:363 start_codon:yes stop_codon:yes gene_type:complete
VRDKLKLTKALVAELPEEFHEPVEVASRTWWANIRKTGGMRLTDHGYYVFSRVLELAHYGIDIKPTPANRRIILTLDRKLQTPYYIELSKRIPVRVYMFGSREAVVAQLYGDLEKFLSNY